MIFQCIFFFNLSTKGCNIGAWLSVVLSFLSALTQAAPPLYEQTDGWLPNHSAHQLTVSSLTLITIYKHDPKMQINVPLVRKLIFKKASFLL